MWDSKEKKFYKYHDINYKVKNVQHINRFLSCWGLQILQTATIKEQVLISLVRLCKRMLLKDTRVVFSDFPDIFLSAKPQEMRMGKGKGTPTIRVVNLKKGKIFIKIYSKNSVLILNKCLSQCVKKFPVPVKIIYPEIFKW